MLKKIKLDLSVPQYKYLTSSADLKCMVAGRSSGKTYAQTLSLLQEPPRSKILFVGQTYTSIKDVCLASLLELHTKDLMYGGKGIIADINRSDMIVKLRNGTIIYYRSAERPDKLRGISSSALYLDEAAYIDVDCVNVCLAACREGRANLNFVSTPCGINNWLYERCVKTPIRKNNVIVRASSFSNLHNTKEFYSTLYKCYSSSLIAQEVFGEWVEIGALIKSEWLKYIDEQALVSGIGFSSNAYGEQRDAKQYATIISVDPAISQEPTADFSGICVANVYPTAEAMVVRELICERLTFQQLFDRVIDFYKKYNCDCAVVEKVGVGAVLFEKLTTEGHYKTYGYIPKTNKLERAGRFISMLERDAVRFSNKIDDEPKAQLTSFTGGKQKSHDDAVDACSLVANYASEQLYAQENISVGVIDKNGISHTYFAMAQKNVWIKALKEFWDELSVMKFN